MEKYDLELLQAGPEYESTDDHWFAQPFVMLSVAKRMSGKSGSLSQYLHILKRMGNQQGVAIFKIQ